MKSSGRRPSLSILHFGLSRSTWNLSSERYGSSASLTEKGKPTHLLKTTQAEQLTKLQNKHQKECDLLEDIRNFSKQRSQIEKEYGQTLQKLVVQYQKKEIMVKDKESEHLTVINVWKAALEAIEQTAQMRMLLAENYKNEIYEDARMFRVQKDGQFKKCQELVTTLHNELTETVKELTRSKKKYYELDQASSLVKEKYDEGNEKLKKNQTGLFKRKSGLEKAVLKLQQKCDESNRNCTVAKNEYLLMISAANAHQKRYYQVDVPEAIRILDGSVFTKLQGYISLISQFELKASSETQTHFVKSLDSTAKISREVETRCFLRENPIFEWAALYEFESGIHDTGEPSLKVEQDGSDNSLNREARKWTFRVERDKQKLEQLKVQLEELRNNSFEKLPGATSEMISQDTENQIEKCKQEIRKVETSCLLGESRLALLKEADVDLDTWTESAKAQLAKNEPLTTPGRLNLRKVLLTSSIDNVSNPAGSSFAIGSPDDHFDEDESDSDDFDANFIDLRINDEPDKSSTHSSNHARNYPVTCTVSYPYQATRIDELTIAVGDTVDVIEDGDLDQWVKAKDSSGNVGFVPEYYLEFPSLAQALKSLTSDEPAACFNNASSLASSSMSSDSFVSGNDQEVRDITSKTPKSQLHGVCLAQAIYKYEACTEDELSFPVGAVIKILDKNDRDDDGWWKGELNGKVGVFPALVVEEIGSKHNKQDSYESLSSDEIPTFLPPPLLPTSLNGGPQTFGIETDGPNMSHAAKPGLTSLPVPSPTRRGRLHSEPTTSESKSGTKRVAPAPPSRPSLQRANH